MQVKHLLNSRLWLLLSCLACASCSNDDTNKGKHDKPGAAVTFEIGFASADGNRTWQTGDAIGIYAVESGSQLQSSDNAIHNVKLVYDGTTWTAEGELRWPGNNVALDFYAYAPYDASAADPLNFTFRIQADQSGRTDDRSNFDLSDLLTAKAAGVAENKPVSLKFGHALALVEVSAKNGAVKGMGPSQHMSVLLDINGRSGFDLGGMTAVAADEPISVNMCRIEQPADANYLTSYTYRAWAPAQNIAAGNSIIIFKAESGIQFADSELNTNLELTSAQTTVLERPVSGLWQTVKILNGKFMMGSPESEPGRDKDEPLHEVTLTRDFHMCQYQITNTQYAEFLNTVGVGEDGKYITASKGEQDLIRSHDQGVQWNSDKWVPAPERDNCPVLCVTWYGADEYARWAHASLPTEAQWEYACRAGTQTAYSFGDDASQLPDYGWFFDNAFPNYPQEVGTKLPNPWGLYDVHGNVLEWCLDTRDGSSSPEDYEPAIDPISPHPGKYYLLRGGNWVKSASTSRSAYRASSVPHLRDYTNGFRIIWVL